MNKSVLNKAKILEYLEFLCEFSDDLMQYKIVEQEDLRRLNREVEKFQSRLAEQNISEDLIVCLEHAKINTYKTSPKRPANLAYYVYLYFILGWLYRSIWERAREMDKKDSLRRKKQIKKFKKRIENIIVEIDEFLTADYRGNALPERQG